MKDPRIEQYARLLVERSVDVQPRETVLVSSHVLGRPLFEEVCAAVARRGAWVLPRLSFGGGGTLAWAREAPEELLAELSPIARHEAEHLEVMIAI